MYRHAAMPPEASRRVAGLGSRARRPGLESAAVHPARSRSRAAIALVVVGFALVALVAAAPHSPLQPILPAGGDSGPVRSLADAMGLDLVHGASLVALAVVAICVAASGFLLVLRSAWRGELSVRTVVVLSVAFHAGVVMLPLLFSRDVYSYAMYGRIAGVYHGNPYVLTPVDFPHDAVFRLVGEKWADTPAVYGPGFTLLSAALTRWIASPSALVSAFRLIAAAASLATVGVSIWLARRIRPERAAFAGAIVGLNPVVLFQSVASGHNDVLVMLAVASALALVVAERRLLATAVLALGVLVKVTAALPLLLLLVAVVAAAPAGWRWKTFAAHAAVAAGVVAAFAVPFLQTTDPTLGLVEVAGHEGWLAPSRLADRVAEAVAGGAGLDSTASIVSAVVRVAFALALVAVIVLLCRHVGRRAAIRRLGAEELGASWGWGLLALMLLGPVLLPWYVAWVLPLAWLLPRVPRMVLIALSVALTLSQWTAEPSRFPRSYDLNILVGHYVITPVVAGLLLWLLADLRRRLRTGAALADGPRDVARQRG
jgi:Glycosyltransferase family 87